MSAQETAGRNADPGDSHSEKKEQLPDDAIVGNSGVEDKHGTEYDQVVMSEEQVDEFFKLAIAKLTSAEEREAIKKKVNLWSGVCVVCWRGWETFLRLALHVSLFDGCSLRALHGKGSLYDPCSVNGDISGSSVRPYCCSLKIFVVG